MSHVPLEDRDSYKARVQNLGPTVLRNGLAAALAFLDRDAARSDSPPQRAAIALRTHLAAARLPGLSNSTGASLGGDVRGLDTDAYVLATRELLRMCVWFKRAVRAWGD
ncbi:MAG: type III-B CRISPR module-associated protein Cmr5 [Anaeromyxobacteraceae bacterium]|nr:type III-B CRISPR module-associated protein Cmr5 [Anaeromyxobacteraceae bacterium]